MRIKELYIDKYKSLRDFRLNLKDSSKEPILFIGENGSGKSNLIEAILRIFMSFDSNSKLVQPREDGSTKDFKYYIKYECRGDDIEIDMQEGFLFKVNERIEFRSLSELKKKLASDSKERYAHRYFPQNIIFYDSGINNRIKQMVTPFTTSFRAAIRQYFGIYRNDYYEADLMPQIRDDVRSWHPERDWDYRSQDKRLTKKYHYIDHRKTDLMLISVMNGMAYYGHFERNIIKRLLRLGNDFSLKFDIKLKKDRTYRNHEKYDEDDFHAIFKTAERIDPEFAHFLERSSRRKYRENSFSLESEKINDFFMHDKVNMYKCFEYLSCIADIDVKLAVRQEDSGNLVPYVDLSEGEKQLASVFALICIYNQQDSLILLDEPETHLNPRWKYEYMNYLKEIIADSVGSQVIVATHEPLLVNGIEKEQVRIFEKGRDGFTKVSRPLQNTFGLGIDGILQSEYYGLTSSYDKRTTDKFSERLLLYQKLIENNGDIQDSEKENLKELTQELGGMTFSATSLDFLYDDFIKAYKKSKFYGKEYLNVNEISARKATIEKIIKELFEEK